MFKASLKYIGICRKTLERKGEGRGRKKRKGMGEGTM